MYKNILILVISFIIYWANVYADMWTSTVSWNNNVVECPTTISHWVTHYWVPNLNTTSSSAVWSSWCTTHTYYSLSNHVLWFIVGSWITACPAWERVVAWNWLSNITCQKYDDTPPNAWDITSSITNWWYFRATNSIPISIIWNSAWWSPIAVLEWQFESSTVPTSFNSAKLSSTDNNPWTLDKLETNENISKVDNSRTVNNYRSYSYNITKICDEAGNCLANPISFTYNVFAWFVNPWLSSTTWASNFIWWQTLNWITRSLTYTLKDDYSNKIIPVYKSDWSTLVRDLQFILNYNNSLYLDQYNKLWSWVDISWVDNPALVASTIWTNINKNVTITDKNNNDWVYIQDFKVYSPTYKTWVTNWQQFVDWNFAINSWTVKLTDNPISDSLQWPLDFDFKPTVYTNISWSIKNLWFIVWTQSGSRIDVIWWTPTNVYLEYWYFDWTNHNAHSKLDLKYSKTFVSPSYVNVKEGHQSSIWWLSTVPNFWTLSSNIFTNLSQSGSLTTAEQNTYFASHIQTVVWLKTSVYSSDIIWMNRYEWISGIDNTSQRWLKITWLTHSQNQIDIVTWQSTTSWDISLLWNLEKSYFQRDVRKNAYSLVKEVTPNNWSLNPIVYNLDLSNDENWVELWDVLYFGWLDWENVEINLSWNYSWVKTILVEWWNVYIKWDILANDKTKDVLWIIALKNDTTWNGWNIYINPNVLEVDSILYADRALVSYDWNELSPANGWTYEYLNKQLYIYWTVFSNNTIGWSVQSPYKCPFYIPNLSCDLDTAQKYDMNYLRRGYQNIIDNYAPNPVPNDKAYPVIVNYNSLIQLTPPKLFEKTQ